MNNIKKGNLNFDQSGRAYPDNPMINENWNCIWVNNGKYYKLVGDNAHKEWEEVDMFNQIIGDAYKNYVSTYENFEWTDDFCKKNLKDCGDQWDVFSQEEFINKCKTNSEFSEQWGLKIEERELSLDERNEIRDMQYFKNRLHQSLKGSDTKINWENIPTKLITVTYKDKTIESYE